MSDEELFTAKDAKEVAGLSYRQLHDWESRDAIPTDEKRERKWRKFDSKQLFTLMVCAEIRDLYGIPVEKIRFIKDIMSEEEVNHFAAAVELMSMGLHVYLLTDFEETFVIDSDLEFEDLMQGYFRVEQTRPFIFLRLNEFVNRLLGMLKEPIEFRPRGELYHFYDRQHAQNVHTQPEMDLLQAVRSGKFDRIEIKLRDGDICSIAPEGDAAVDVVESADDAVSVKRRNEFETLVLKFGDGRVVNARRRLPRKYTKSDNEIIWIDDVVVRLRAKKSRRK